MVGRGCKRRPFRPPAALVALAESALLLLLLCAALGPVRGGDAGGAAHGGKNASPPDLVANGQGDCSPGCKRVFVGDGHCDKECFTDACEWDGGDCESSCELRKLVVMGPYYKEVDHVEYQCVGLAGQKRTLPIAEALAWEGKVAPRRRRSAMADAADAALESPPSGGADDDDGEEDYEDEDEDWRQALFDL